MRRCCLHCTAGKDRTGFAAALLLTALGVPREAVIDDYLLTNTAVDLRSQLMNDQSGFGIAPSTRFMVDLRRDAQDALLAADADYLQAAFDALEASHGSVDAYLSGAIGCDAGHARETRAGAAGLKLDSRRGDTMRSCGLMAAMVAALVWTSVAAAADAIPPPLDVAYPGVVRLQVDATDLDHRVFQVRETVPVIAGPLVLLYPKWLPGNHSTTGPVELLAGLTITARPGGQRVEWRRDPEMMHAFHLDVPAGVTELELGLQFVTPTGPDQGRRVMTPDLFGLHWEKALLYPAGHYARRITFEPSIRLPAGWQFASALDGAHRQRRHGRVRAGVARDAGRCAAVCGAVLQAL